MFVLYYFIKDLILNRLNVSISVIYKQLVKVSYYGHVLKQNRSSSRKSTKQTRIRNIILDRYDVYQDLDDYKDHCLTLENMPYRIIGYIVYETLVKMKNELVLVLIHRMMSTRYAVSISKLHQISKIMKT